VDHTAFDSVAQSVEHVDSGGRQDAISPKGAVGVMQIMPTTARKGVNIYDETQNRVEGRRQLAELYDKYGNWPDTLAAYNWGPGNVDKWIAGGRDPSKLPKETQAYVPAVLRGAGLPTTGVAAALTSAKRELTPSDLADVPTSAIAAPVGEDGETARIDRAQRSWQWDITKDLEPPEELHAIATGMRRGIQSLVLGPAQAGLEQVAPQWAQHLTTAVNNFEEANISTARHPALAQLGEVAGTTVGVLATAGALGDVSLGAAASRYLPAVSARLGAVARGAGVGALSGATVYNPDESTSRVWETVFGAGVGVLGATVGRAVLTAARNVADRTSYATFIRLLQESTAGLSPSLSRLKDTFLEHYEELWRQKNELYTLRNKAGEELVPGLPREEVSAAVKDALVGTRLAGVAPTPTTRAVAAQVDRELGGQEARAAEAAHDARVQQWERETTKWQSQYGAPMANMSPHVRAQYGANIPQAPVHPGEFEAEPVTATQFSAAVQAINRAWVRAGRDPATRSQLAQMSRRMVSAADEAAQDAGMSAEEFLRRAEDAGAFFKREIGPVYRMFHNQTPAQLRGEAGVPGSGISPAKMFDDAVQVLEGHDMQAIATLRAVLGKRAEPELMRAVAYRMLTKSEGKPGEIVKYIREHREALQALLSRDMFTQLEGYGRIAQRMVDKPDVLFRMERTLAKMAHHPWVGGLAVLEGVLHGRPGWAAMGAGVLAAPTAVHMTFRLLTALQESPAMRLVFKSAARTKPDSPAMDALIGRVEERMRRAAAVAARVATQPSTQPSAP
jgi:hypothetical protein